MGISVLHEHFHCARCTTYRPEEAIILILGLRLILPGDNGTRIVAHHLGYISILAEKVQDDRSPPGPT
jgi:hypothetical protein